MPITTRLTSESNWNGRIPASFIPFVLMFGEKMFWVIARLSYYSLVLCRRILGWSIEIHSNLEGTDISSNDTLRPSACLWQQTCSSQFWSNLASESFLCKIAFHKAKPGMNVLRPWWSTPPPSFEAQYHWHWWHSGRWAERPWETFACSHWNWKGRELGGFILMAKEHRDPSCMQDLLGKCRLNDVSLKSWSGRGKVILVPWDWKMSALF